jgi:hypothetical protein
MKQKAGLWGGRINKIGKPLGKLTMTGSLETSTKHLKDQC